jgi:hypothetical protein
MSDAEVKEDRQRRFSTLPKGHLLEFDTAHSVGYDSADVDGDAVAFEKPASGPVTPEQPRTVVGDMTQQIVQWALDSPDNAHKAAQIMRNGYPEYRNLTDEEIIAKIVEHYEEMARKVTRQVYQKEENRWDKGNDLTAWRDGIWRPSPT